VSPSGVVAFNKSGILLVGIKSIRETSFAEEDSPERNTGLTAFRKIAMASCFDAQ
jgi:hypothetical protein